MLVTSDICSEPHSMHSGTWSHPWAHILFPPLNFITCLLIFWFYNIYSSVQFSHSVMSNSLWLHGQQHASIPCPSPNTGAYWNSCPSYQWCHTTISSFVHLSSSLQSFPASGYFQVSQLFTSGGQSTGVSASASVLPMTIQDWFTLGLTGWISLQSKGLSRVFYNTTVQKHKFFGA